MSTASRILNGTRALFATAKSRAAVGPVKKTTTAAKSSPKTVTKAPTKKPRSAPLNILKEIPVSPVLSDFLGVSESSRPNALKKVWDHIKLHNLQNPANRREIICDEKLKLVFDGKDKVGMLEIGKLLSSHFVKTA